MQLVSLNPILTRANTYYDKKSKIEVQQYNNKVMNDMTGAHILGLHNQVFMSKNSKKNDLSNKEIPNYSERLVSPFADGEHSYALKNNPELFYIRNAKSINSFLRKGELIDVDDEYDNIPDFLQDMLDEEVSNTRDYNRAIVDSVGVLDSMMLSKTTEPIVVYRYAPEDWLETSNNAILKDDGFFSTTMLKNPKEKDYTNENNTTCFEVLIPEGVPYLPLNSDNEYGMLFPRGLKFRVLDNKSLEMLYDAEQK
jgi:hypothetical protein